MTTMSGDPPNLLDFYTRLMTVSAEGSQQSLTQTYLLLRLDALAVVALLAALIVAWYALTCMPTLRESLQQWRWQRTWEAVLREDPRRWPHWQLAQQDVHWQQYACNGRKGKRR